MFTDEMGIHPILPITVSIKKIKSATRQFSVTVTNLLSADES